MSAVPVLHALETAVDIDKWLVKYQRQPDDLVVALSPEAVLRLEELGIAHTTIEDYYTEEALYANAKDANEITIDVCDAIDRIMGIKPEDPLPSFSAHYYAGTLRVLYGSLLRAAFMLSALFDQVSPGRVVLSATAPDPSAVFIQDRRFLSWVLGEVSRQKGIAPDTFTPTESPDREKFSIPAAALDILRWGLNIFRERLIGRGDIAYFRGAVPPKQELAHFGLRVVQLPSCRQAGVQGNILNFDTPDFGEIAPHFNFDGVDLSGLVLPSLATLAGPLKARHLACLKRAEQIIGKSGCRAVVVSGAMSVGPVSMLLAARRQGIPAVVVQHGGGSGYCYWSTLKFIDIHINDHYLVYTDGMIEDMRSLSEKTTRIRDRKVNVYATGHRRAWDIHQARGKVTRGSRPRVLYVTGSLRNSTNYMSGHHRSGISYWRTKTKVLQQMARHSADWDVHFRPPPNSTDLALVGLPDEDRKNIILRSENDFASVLENEYFDLIIVDTLATAFLKCLATDSRIIAWIDPVSMQFDPDAIKKLKRRADVAFSPQAYLDSITQALNEMRAPCPVDDSFLFRYALSGKDKPADLEAEVLAKIVGEK